MKSKRYSLRTFAVNPLRGLTMKGAWHGNTPAPLQRTLPGNRRQKWFTVLALMLLILNLFLTDGFATTRPSLQAAATTANDTIPAYTDTFRFGTNMGHRNDNWTDSQYSDLIAPLGMNSFRVKLPENYLNEFGYNIALSNMQHYQAIGLKNLTATLGVPTAAHSKAPSGDLEANAPANLYQPVFNADGSINANNYWASYVYQTVSVYKPYVKIWEIWNEPDFTDNYAATQADWYSSPPNPTDLPRWNDTIFSYIRLLRVSYEVIKRVDPGALIATGGFGYESFLDGVLRYTDNPNNGAVSSEYPLAGGAYFEVLSYHYYPQFGVKSLATGQFNNNTDSDSNIAKLLTMRDNFRGKLTAYNYGSRYPTKYFIVTESGISSQPIQGYAGSMELLRNYLMKAQVIARTNDLRQFHTYILSDEEADAARSDSYRHMGLYYDIVGLSNPAQANRKPASYGVETIARTLEGTSYDAAATLALNLPLNVRGAVFQGQTLGQPFIVLWAQTAGNNETVTLDYKLPSPVKLRVRDWQWSQTKTEPTLFPVNGQVPLTLSAIPLVLIPQLAPPTLSQTFKPFAVGPGDSATLEFTLSNPNLYASLTGLSFSTNLPAPLKIANPAGTSNNCGNGLVTAVADSTGFSLTGLTLTPKQSCRLAVKVSSPLLGNFSTQPISIAADVGPGVASNTTSLSVLTPQVVTTVSDSPVIGQLTLRQAIANAVGPNGGVINFSPALGPNPQINLATPLIVSPKTVIWNASCTNRVRLNANFAKVLQLGGNTYIRGLDIVTTLGPGIKAVSNGNQLECTSVKS